MEPYKSENSRPADDSSKLSGIGFVGWYQAFGSICVGIAGVLILFALELLVSAWGYRQNACPSTDILSWDGNLRLMGAIDQYFDWKAGRWSAAILGLLSAETWPPLRDLLHHLVFALQGSITTDGSVLISTIFLALLLPSALYISVRLLGGWWGAIAASVFCVLVLHGHEFLRFALTGMLETQAMFFMLWAVYFWYRLYSPSGRASDGSLLLKVRVGVCASLLGLFFTKYPYGPMFLIAILVVEATLYPRATVELLLQLWSSHYRGWRAALGLAVVVGIVALSKLGAIGDAGRYARFWKALIILFSFLAVVDLGVLLLGRRDDLWPQLSDTLRTLILGLFLPMLAWLFVYPTRFKTLLGTQQRIVESPGLETFAEMLLSRSVEIPGAMLVLVSGGLVVVLLELLQRKGGVTAAVVAGGESFAPVRRSLPGWALLAFLGVQLLLLDISTVNRQERHIYHLVPAIVLALLVILMAPLRKQTGSFTWQLRLVQSLPAVLVLAFLAMPLRQAWALRQDLARGSQLCANPPNEFVAPVRSLVAQAQVDKRVVLINTFHSELAGWPYRPLATPVDLLLRFRALGAGGEVRNDNRFRYKSWSGFDRVALVTAACDDATAGLLTTRAQQTGATVKLDREVSLGKEAVFCLREYALNPLPISGSAEKQ